jgi:hypothetical protein
VNGLRNGCADAAAFVAQQREQADGGAVQLRRDVRKGGDLHLVRLRVNFNKHVTSFHAIVIVDQHAGYLTADSGRDEGHVAIHVRVIGRDGIQRMMYAWNAD